MNTAASNPIPGREMPKRRNFGDGEWWKRLLIQSQIHDVSLSLSWAKVWALLLYIAQSAALLGVMAHGFG